MRIISVVAIVAVVAVLAGGASALGLLVLEWLARLVVNF